MASSGGAAPRTSGSTVGSERRAAAGADARNDDTHLADDDARDGDDGAACAANVAGGVETLRRVLSSLVSNIRTWAANHRTCNEVRARLP